jgi:hypothetical protein
MGEGGAHFTMEREHTLGDKTQGVSSVMEFPEQKERCTLSRRAQTRFRSRAAWRASLRLLTLSLR